MLYYNSTQNPESVIYNDRGEQLFGLKFCIPDDITDVEVHGLMTKNCTPDVDVLGACTVLMQALSVYINTADDDIDEESRQEGEGLAYKSMCEILAAIDDFFGISLQARGCYGGDWASGVSCVGRPEDIKKLPRIDDELLEELEEEYSGPRPGI